MGVSVMGTLRKRRRSRRKGTWKAPLAVVALLLLGAIACSEWGLGSVSEELTQEAARGYVLSCVNQAVEEALEEDGNQGKGHCPCRQINHIRNKQEKERRNADESTEHYGH